MPDYEISTDELIKRADNGDWKAEIALEFRAKGKKAVVDIIRSIKK